MPLARSRSPPPCPWGGGAGSIVWWYLRGASSSNRTWDSEVKGEGGAGVPWGSVYFSPVLRIGVGADGARWVSVTLRYLPALGPLGMPGLPVWPIGGILYGCTWGERAGICSFPLAAPPSFVLMARIPEAPPWGTLGRDRTPLLAVEGLWRGGRLLSVPAPVLAAYASPSPNGQLGRPFGRWGVWSLGPAMSSLLLSDFQGILRVTFFRGVGGSLFR